MNVKIIVATHKKYQMPDDKYYLPLHVGKEGKEDIGFLGDNTGDNISVKNPYYCELTGLYWAWKNLDADYIGLVHYRRHFTNKSSHFRKKNGAFASVLTSEEIDNLLKETDVILPTKRKYYIETLYSHYDHTMHIETLDETRKIISEDYKEYLDIFDSRMKKTYAHMFNMFIMKKKYLNDYCEWLFSILEKLESRIDVNKYDSFHARFYGRISELLLDVWIEKNNVSYKEVHVMSMEKVNWIKKGTSFLRAKFLKKKYDKSF